MTKDYLEFNNGKIYYELSGNGEVIVFIHGFSLDHSMWKYQRKVFSKKYQILTYDLRGFGKSSDPSVNYSHYEDLKALLDHLSVKKAHIVGLSLGGGVAIDFVIAYPEYALSLTAADSVLRGFAGTINWNVPAKEKTVEEAKQAWLEHEVFETTRKNKQVSHELESIVDKYQGWHWLNKDLKKSVGTPAIDRLNSIATPTCLIVGEYDLPYFHSISKVINEGVPNSRLHVIKGAGHMTNMEKPDEFNSHLLDLFKNLH